MTALAERIAAIVEASGPIGIADYMAMCLFDAEHGYYTTREPFGVEGDFVTAPEISQMFGELVGVWLRLAWEAIGRPVPIRLVEIGPGRGTLMKDVLRTLARIAPDLSRGLSVALVEVSDRLAETQRRTLAGEAVPISWHASLDTLPQGPSLVVGNEIFDAIPIRQFVRTGGAWRERCVGIDPEGNLCLVAGAGSLDRSLLPLQAAKAREGALVEIAPARTALMEAVCRRLSEDGGAALFADYGYGRPALGDTLQALRRHERDPVLAHPGEADLTAHVDFLALAGVSRSTGLQPRLLTQGRFLLGLGLLERAGSLGASRDEGGRDTIRAAVDRLAGPNQMGTLFKVLAVTPPGIVVPPFDGEDPDATS